MTDKEILEKAIQKAIDNGFSAFGYSRVESVKKYFADDFYHIFLSNPTDLEEGDVERYSANDIIFNHKFAKALWGEENAIQQAWGGYYDSILEDWQYHLQQLVIADDHIKYLEENI